jgi:hypothetical protein
VFQIFCGAFLIKIFGFSYSVLHGFSYIMGLISVITLYLICLEFKFEKKKAFICTFILMANPIFLCLSFTFMTDVFSLALSLLSILFFTKGFNAYYFLLSEKKSCNNLKFYIIGLVISLFAILVRQTAIIIPISAGLSKLIIHFRSSGRLLKKKQKQEVLFWIGFFFVIPLVILVLFHLWQGLVFGVSGSLGEKIDFIKNNWHFGLIPYRTYSIFCYLGLFLLPIIIGSISTKNTNFESDQGYKKRDFFKNNILILSIGLLFLGLFVFYLFSKGEKSTFFPEDKISSFFPYFENIITNFCLGPLTLRDTYILHHKPPFELSFSAILIISILGVISGSIIFSSFIKKIFIFFESTKYINKKLPNNLPSIFLIFIAGLYILQMFFYNKVFDRYVVFLIPLFVILLQQKRIDSDVNESVRDSGEKLFFYVSGFLTLIYFIISIAGVHDYISWNQSRWDGINYLLKKGISPNSIDGGFEFNGLYTYDPKVTYNIEKNRKELSWWWVIDDEYVISFNEIPGFVSIKAIAYRTLIPFGQKRIFILKRE